MSYEPPYRSGKIAVAAALSVALLLIAAGYQLAQRPQEGVQVRTSERTATSVERPQEIDSDGDGIFDWEEQLSGSNPYDAASAERATFSSTSATSSSTPLSVTGIVAQELVGEYLSLQRIGSYEGIDGTNIGSKLANRIQASTTFEPYTQADVRIGASSSSAERREEYQRAMEDALEPLLSLEQAEFEVYARAVQTGDSSYLTELRNIARVYEQAAANVMSVSVPSDASATHLEAANALAYYGAILEHLVHYVNDPIASLALLRSYNEAEQYMFEMFTRLGAYYRSSS